MHCTLCTSNSLQSGVFFGCANVLPVEAGDLIKQISPRWGLLILAKSHRHHLGLQAVKDQVTTQLPVALHYHVQGCALRKIEGSPVL